MKNRDMQIVQMEKFYLVLESKCAQNGGHWFSFLDNPPIQMKYPETDILTAGEGGIGSVTFRDFLLFGCGRTCWQGCFVLETTEITRRNSQLFKTPKISEKY